MTKRTNRVLLEVGGYDKKFHYAVIGDTNRYYLWCKYPNMKGKNSPWFEGEAAFKNFVKMEELLTQSNSKHGFVSYLSDLFKVLTKDDAIT